MSPDQFDEDLRAVMRRVVPPEAPDDLRLRIAAVTDAPATGTPGFGWSRWLMTAAVVAAVAVALVYGLTRPPSTGPGPSSTPQPSLPLGVIPWIDATPSASPTAEPTPDPLSLPACSAANLALAGVGWEGATGSLAGGAMVVNVSFQPCRVGGEPAVKLLDAAGSVIADGGSATPGNAVVLPGAGVATAGVVWMNWCGPAPSLPLSLRITLPEGGGQLTGPLRAAFPGALKGTPRCDAPGTGSTIGVPTPFTAPETSSGGSQPQPCKAGQLLAYSGEWGAGLGTAYASLVVLNVGEAGAFPCQLPASPVLELRDAQGRLLVTAQPITSLASTIVLPAEQAAAASIGLSNWCISLPPRPLQLDLVIGSDQVNVTARSVIPVPPCGSNPQTPPPAFFLNNPLTIPGSPAPAAPFDPCPAGTQVSVSLSPLPTTNPGGTLSYTVTLTNHLAYDKPFNPAAFCPNYTERLLLPGSGRTIDTHLALNWPEGEFIPGGGSVTFAMRLVVPTDSATGTATLVWILGDRGPSAKATFSIGR